jgi:hypothetical protein
MITIPEIKLKAILDGLLSYVSTDWNNYPTDRTKTYLYRLFYGNVLGGFDFYTQSIEILNRTAASSRKLETRLEFDRERAMLPTIFINTPSDRLDGENSIGMGSLDEYYYEEEDGVTTDIYRRTFGGEYELIITSSNQHETLLIYNLLKALFVSAADTLAMQFDGTFSYVGKKLLPKDDMTPTPLYMRAIGIHIQYTLEVPSIVKKDLLGEITFAMATIIEDE